MPRLASGALVAECSWARPPAATYLYLLTFYSADLAVYSRPIRWPPLWKRVHSPVLLVSLLTLVLTT